jgi:membrane associated rhomboid family serine protease
MLIVIAVAFTAQRALPTERLMLWPLGETGSGFMPWQLLTYALLHVNLAHLAPNLLTIAALGAPLERAIGARRLAQYFLACVAGGGLAHAALSTHPVVGASGGAFGLLIAYGTLHPVRPLRRLVFAAIALLLIVATLQPGVAQFAHLGGAVTGWAVIRWWRRPK